MGNRIGKGLASTGSYLNKKAEERGNFRTIIILFNYFWIQIHSFDCVKRRYVTLQNQISNFEKLFVIGKYNLKD